MTHGRGWDKWVTRTHSRLWRYAVTGVLALGVTLAASPPGSARSAAPVFQAYLPVVSSPAPIPSMPGMGVAGLAYPELLNAEWHYAYEWCGFHMPGCTPMVKHWEMPELCPPVLLVGNEPNGTPPPDGSAMTPAEGAQRSRDIRNMCPREQTFLIVGNVAQADVNWTQQYLDAGGQYDALGVHCYAGPTSDACISALTVFKDTFAPASICVTEWNLLTVQMDPVEFERFMDFIVDLTPCSAVFSDIYQGLYWSWNPIYWMVEADGVLNPRGEIYADR